MANTITAQKLADGPRNVHYSIFIAGDATGDETGFTLVDVSTLEGYGVDWNEVKIIDVQSNLDGFSAQLQWDATANTDAVQLLNGATYVDWKDVDGLINNAGTGKTGNIILVTSGLGAEDGTIVLKLKKRGG